VALITAMANPYFHFKQFTVHHDRCAMKVTTDACLFGAWCADELLKTKEKIKSLLDIGSGTGLLSLMVMQKNDVNIDAVEIDESAAEQATENFTTSVWKDRLQVLKGDVTQMQLPQYDCIISNPPFYENELQSPNSKRNVAHHSHGLKLDDLLQIIDNHLSDEGFFFLLLPYKRIDEAKQLMQKNNLYPFKELIAHQSLNHPPFRYMVMGSKKGFENVDTKEIFITSSPNNYTEDFIKLLKEYYLNL
jgi:tRNA1Val (adenine37-N6)-methyltransferase